MKSTYWIVLAHLVLLATCGLLLEFFIQADGSIIHKLLAGFFVGTYAMFGKEIAKLGLACIGARGLPQFDKNKWSNGFTIVSLFVMALVGLLAWMVSWEGTTGIPFGLAVFAAALTSDEGLAPLFEEFSPSTSKEAS